LTGALRLFLTLIFDGTFFRRFSRITRNYWAGQSNLIGAYTGQRDLRFLRAKKGQNTPKIQFLEFLGRFQSGNTPKILGPTADHSAPAIPLQ